jgi:TolB-like protein/Tfp pilus assembly protein PilF
METLASSEVFLFEGFRLDRCGGGLLQRDDNGDFAPVAVGSRGLDILGVLVARAGEVVSKEEIISAVWPNTVVEDSNLTVQISALRRVLDGGRAQRSCIQTVPGRGYRFVAPMMRAGANPGTVEQSQNAAPSTPHLSIVVLPFANLSNDPEQEYFVDAITNDLTTDLSRISGSFVIACSTAFTYKNKPVDVRHVGRELGVRYVLEGSVRRSGDQVRANVQLVDAESGAHLWADRFDTERMNLAEAQNEITGRIARTLNLAVVEDVIRRIELGKTVDPNAQDFVMRGWGWFYRSLSPENRRKARRAFEAALQIDPESVDARIGLGMILVTNLAQHWTTSIKQDEANAEQFLLEALDRDANRSMAHLAMGLLRRLQNRLADAQAELETAVALDPNNVSALHQLALTSMWLGQPHAAIMLVEKGIRLSPHDAEIAFPYSVLGMSLLLLGESERAMAPLRKARSARPQLYYTHMNLAAALGLNGEVEETKLALAKAIDIKPEFSSLARLRSGLPWASNPQYMALAENTFHAGLRKAGMPEE